MKNTQKTLSSYFQSLSKKDQAQRGSVVTHLALIPKMKPRSLKTCPVCRGFGWNYEQIFYDHVIGNKLYKIESQNCIECNGEKVIWV